MKRLRIAECGLRIAKIRIQNKKRAGEDARAPGIIRADGGVRAPRQSVFRIPHYIILGLLISIIAGCFYEEPLSWSPDGRYLAYAASERGALWRWDARTRQSEKIEFSENNGWQGDNTINERVLSCTYFSNDAIAFMTEVDKDHAALYLAEMKEKQCRRVAVMTGPSFDVSAAGRIYFQGEDPDLAGVVSLLEYSGGMDGSTRTLLTQADNITFLRIDPEGGRLAFSDDRGLHLFDLSSSTTQTLLEASEAKYFWPVWAGEDRMLVTQKTSENRGNLLELKLEGRATRTLAENVSLATPPTLSPGGRTAAFVAQPPGNNEGTDQIAAVDVESGRLAWLTDEVFGVTSPVYSPDGNSLAYLVNLLSKTESDHLLKVLDLAGGRAEVVWHSEEERLYAGAETMVRAGAPAQALAALQDLLARFPKTTLRIAAQYRMMLLYLEGPLADLDQATALWRELGQEVDTQEMPPEIARMFWRTADRVATDPAGDWITAFNTPEASKAFKGANTDEARDLRALWVRAGKDKLYVRIDIGDKAGLDPSGVALLDTLILIKDAATSDTVPTAVGPHAAWRHTATRQVLVRHWAVGGAGSQYDVEVWDEKGETIHRFLASGFAPPCDPLFDRVAFVPAGETRGAVYAISREALGLKGGHKIAVQVLTLKGGIDPRGATERSAETGCGVADAFGPDNDPAKIRARIKPGEPCIIEDTAAVVAVD